MIYIDSNFDDSTSINNLVFFDDYISVENSDGFEIKYGYDDKVCIRVFERVYPESLKDIIEYSKNKNVYVAVNDIEQEAIFNNFPEINFKNFLNEDDDFFDIDELNEISKYCWGLLKKKEGDVTFKQLKKILESED